MNTLKNKVQLLGNLGAAPETRKLDNGNMMAKMRIATNETYKNAQGERVTDTQWHTVIAWGKLAELTNHLEKGSQVLIEGRLCYREYTTPDGQKRYFTEIVANELEFLSKNRLEVSAA